MKIFSKQTVFVLGLIVLLTNAITAQWIQISRPNLSDWYLNTLLVNGANVFVGTIDSGIFLTTNNGLNWTPVNNGLTAMDVSSLAVNGHNIFAGTSEGVFRSTDNGNNWIPITSGHVPVHSLIANGTNLLAGIDNSVFLSTIILSKDNGNSWATVCSAQVSFSAFASIGNSIFAGSWCQGLFRSDNNGTSWTKVNTSLCGIHALATIGNSIFAGLNMFEDQPGGVFRSNDNGTNWTQVALKDTTVISLAVSGNSIFAGTSLFGIFLSNDNGLSWTSVNLGLSVGDLMVTSIAVSETDVFAAALGVWRRPLSEMITITNPKTQEKVFLNALAQNSANSNVTIEFYLPHSYQTSIKIYNLSGNEIACPANKTLGAGSHIIVWNTRNIVAGYYLIRMQFGVNTIVKNILVSR